MTFTFTPTIMTTAELPAFAAPLDTRATADASASFGPSLAEARQQFERQEDPAFEPFERRSENRADPSDARTSDSAEPRERPDAARSDSDRPDRAASDRSGDDRPVAENDRTRPDNDDTDSTEVSADETSSDDSTGTEVANDSDAPSDAAAAMAALLHPTAKGADGESGPSSVPTLEGAASPTSLDVVGQSMAGTDAEAVLDLVDGTDGEMRLATQQAGLTLLDAETDADLTLADRSSVVAEDQSGAEGAAEVSLTETSTVPDGAVDGGDAARVDDVAAEVTQNATPTASVESIPVNQAAATTTAINNANPSNADSVVVLAREAAGVTEVSRASSANATQAATPQQTAEANLWEDVRSAFERIRTTGDSQEIKIRLRPAELGELLVQVRTQGEQVSVRLVASSAAAQQALVDDRLRLAAELARAGFEQGSVDIGQQQTGDDHRQSADQNGQSEQDQREDRRIGVINGTDQLASAREAFERRDPIVTEAGFRPGRSATSTINLAL